MEITLQKRQKMYKIRKIKCVNGFMCCEEEKKKAEERVRRRHGRGVKRRKQHVPSIEGHFSEVTRYT